MPLWLLFTIAFLALAIASVGSVWFFTTSVLYPLIPERAYLLVTSQAVFLAGFVLLVIALLFVLLGRVIARPTRKLTEATVAFAKNGKHVLLVTPSLAPKEIQQLTRSFVDLMGSVEALHKRDTETSRVKSDFISTAAHQLRTPLTGVRWALEALQKSQLTEDQLALVKNAADKSHELVAIVGTLLDISAIESGKYKYRLVSADMAALLAGVGQDFEELAKSRGVSLLYKPVYKPGEHLPEVRCDAERITWVLNNLVENAIRYTPEGGSVRLGARLRSDRVLVTVRDTGIGISPQDRGNIFERFFRGGNAIAKENQGNGLGLYIARTIATDHGGDLDFGSNSEGPGTTFTLSLPIAGPART